jgi:hypothetical protein
VTCPPPTETDRYASISHRWIHVPCRGGSALGNCPHGLHSRSNTVFIQRKRIPRNNSLTLWRPRFLQMISVADISNTNAFVFEASVEPAVLGGFIQRTFVNKSYKWHSELGRRNWNLNHPHFNIRNIIHLPLIRFHVLLLCAYVWNISDIH